jgi:hypothetical protein
MRTDDEGAEGVRPSVRSDERDDDRDANAMRTIDMTMLVDWFEFLSGCMPAVAR